MTDFGTIAAFAAPIISAALTFLLTKRKSSAETRKVLAETSSIEIKNAEAVINLWMKMAKDLAMQMNTLEDRVKNLQEENQKLREEIEKLEAMIENRLP